MKTTKPNKEIITSLSSDITAKSDSKSLFQSVMGIALGFATILCAALYVEDHKSTIFMLLMTLGVIIVIYFIIRMSSRNVNYYYKQTNSILDSFTIYYDPAQRVRLQQAIEHEGRVTVPGLDLLQESSLRIDYLVSKDGKFAACQMYHYVPYNYEPASAICCIDPAPLREILK